jgi:peptidylprolyl isomerase
MALPKMTSPLAVALVFGALALGVSACSSADTPAASGCAIAVSTDTGSKPAITVPSCATKPTSLQVTDVVAGSGVAAKAGDSVSVKYAGFGFDNHEQFDASWDNGLGTFAVTPLGHAPVIDGWNQGLVGAQVGTRRLLVIPPDLGYGAEGSPPDIAPNETLIFVVDVVSIKS